MLSCGVASELLLQSQTLFEMCACAAHVRAGLAMMTLNSLSDFHEDHK